jgi:hypothetical protein
MSDPAASQLKGQIARYGMAMVVIASAIWFSIDQPGEPIRETTGIIQSALPLANNTQPTTQVATVRLSDGSSVQANVILAARVSPGQVAKMRVYRKVLSGGQTYEIVGIEGSK